MRVTKSQCRKGSFFCGSPIEYPIGAVSQRTLCETLLCHLAVNARPGEAPCPPLAGYPEAIPVPVLLSRSVPSLHFLSLGASHRGPGSFRNLHGRNLHLSQETGSGPDLRRRGSRRWLF